MAYILEEEHVEDVEQDIVIRINPDGSVTDLTEGEYDTEVREQQ